MPLFNWKTEKDNTKPRFLEILRHKLGKLILINLLYLAVLLPFILSVYSVVFINVYALMDRVGMREFQIWTFLLHITLLYSEYVPAAVQAAFLIFSILCFGPMKAGITYVLRNYSSGRHSWVSDVFEKAKENLKQGLLFGILDFLILFLVLFNLSVENSQGTMFIVLAKYISVAVALIYSVMRKYIYIMIVTIELPVRILIKNAWVFSIGGFFRNLGVLAANMAFWLVSIYLFVFVNPLLEIAFLIIYSFTNYLGVFVCYPLVDEFLVKPAAE